MKAGVADITGVVLAGGQGSRMGGVDKGLLRWRGEPLIAPILAGLQPQVGQAMINANRRLEEYQAFGVPVVGDTLADFQGPLAGMLVALQHASTAYVLCVPCDTPRVFPSLATRPLSALQAQQADIAVVHDGKHLQPMHVLLATHLLSSLQAYLAAGGRSPQQWFAQQRVATVDCSDAADYFRGINTPAEQQALEQIVPVPILGFCAYSGTGKTTLLTQLIPLLKAQGLRLAVIKHTHHVIDVDKPGKDSYRMREAGAEQVILASKQRLIVMRELPQAHDEALLADALATIPAGSADLILIEGFKHEPFPRIEVHRKGLGNPLLFPSDPHIIAIATDDVELHTPDEIKYLNLNVITEITTFVRQWCLQQSGGLSDCPTWQA